MDRTHTFFGNERVESGLGASVEKSKRLFDQ